MGRTALPERARWHEADPSADSGIRIAAIRELEALGASVHVAALDVANENALARFLRQFRAEQYPAIGGVIHCAGVASPALLEKLAFAAWAERLKGAS